MKNKGFYIGLMLLTMFACKKEVQQTGDIIHVDVLETSYPEKELLLQDFMDVEYIPLETNDEFINQGFVQDVGEKYILVKNRKNGGDVFVYDRKGKALHKFNRKGQGAEEYVNITGMVLDEKNEEIFINSHHIQKILVYDLYGNYKRTLKHQVGKGSLKSYPYYSDLSSFYLEIYNYDDNNLICYDFLDAKTPFVLVSKKDGSITKKITIPFDKKKTGMVVGKKDEKTGLIVSASSGYYRSVLSYQKDWFLVEFSSDTIYQLLPDNSLSPFIVRTPSVDDMNPEVFLMIRLLADRYIFMETVKNEYDFEKNTGFPRTFLMYDKKENAFFNYKVCNGDYRSEKEIYMNVLRPLDGKIAAWDELEAADLLESLEKDELKGELKEIAEGLTEDSNPVIMLVKHRTFD